MNTQKIAIFGGIGKTGNHIIAAALKNKHKVTAIVFDAGSLAIRHPDLTIEYGHMMNRQEVEKNVKGHDVVIGVHEPLPIHPEEHIRAVKSVIEGTKRAGVERLLVVGHPVFRPVENTLDFYDLWKPLILVQREVMKIFQDEITLDWGYMYTPKLVYDERTGRFTVSPNFILETPDEMQEVNKQNFTEKLFGEVAKGTHHRWADSMLLNI